MLNVDFIFRQFDNYEQREKSASALDYLALMEFHLAFGSFIYMVICNGYLVSMCVIKLAVMSASVRPDILCHSPHRPLE